MVDNNHSKSKRNTVIMVVLAVIVAAVIITVVYNKTKPEEVPPTEEQTSETAESAVHYTNSDALGALTEDRVLAWYEGYSNSENLADADALLVCGFPVERIEKMLTDICADQQITPVLTDKNYFELPSGYNEIIQKTLMSLGAETIFKVTSENTARLIICAVQ